ncbi:MAG: ABC transporter ATP-binding protein [Hyphomicrobiales bacterium]|nr:ABC transporter ATP-binding protein [Hyphomicrobiales bacterium]
MIAAPSNMPRDGSPILEVDSLTRQFGGLVAVNDVSFSVRKGEILGIIGPNGAGKTTLFSLISGFMKPTKGEVRFCGERITGLTPNRIAEKGLARSFQITQAFGNMTIRDTVTAASLLRRPLIEAQQHADSILDETGLWKKRNEFSTSLSPQDQKLLEVAKCLATDPLLILLDEVMAGLTLAEAEVPLAIVRLLHARGISFVLIEHVMPIVMKTAERIIVLNFGQKVGEGTPEEIVRLKDVKDAYFGEEVDA